MAAERQSRKVRGERKLQETPRAGFVLRINSIAHHTETVFTLAERYRELDLPQISALENVILSYDIDEASVALPRSGHGRWYIYVDPLAEVVEQRTQFFRQLISVYIQRELAKPDQDIIRPYQ